ncbi:hypothetical protein D3C85_1001730 [compost metagenome]
MHHPQREGQQGIGEVDGIDGVSHQLPGGGRAVDRHHDVGPIPDVGLAEHGVHLQHVALEAGVLGHVEDPEQAYSGVEGEAAQVGPRPLEITGDQVVDHAARLVEVLHQVVDAILHPLRHIAGIAMHHWARHIGLQHVIVDRPHGSVGALERIARIAGRAGRFGTVRGFFEIQALWARLGRATRTAPQ